MDIETLTHPEILALIGIMVGFWFLGSHLKKVDKRNR